MKRFKDLSFRDKTIISTSIAAFSLGWIISFIGLFLPPIGEIDNSVIVITGQGMTYAATGLGLKSYVDVKLKNKDEN